MPVSTTPTRSRTTRTPSTASPPSSATTKRSSSLVHPTSPWCCPMSCATSPPTASGEFLGLTGPGRAYASGLTGENVVVGVIDTGIWPEHPSFADDGSYGPSPLGPLDETERPVVRLRQHRPQRERQAVHVQQQAARRPPDARHLPRRRRCRSRRVRLRSRRRRPRHPHGLHRGRQRRRRRRRSSVATSARSPGSPRGRASSPTRDSATAAASPPTSRQPSTRPSPTASTSSTTRSAAAPTWPRADAIAYLFAADAGVWVATSAGNSGPGAGTIGGPADVPWVTAVGASTQERFFQGTVELGATSSNSGKGHGADRGKTFTGASMTPGTDRLPLVDAASAGSDLCLRGTLEPRGGRRARSSCAAAARPAGRRRASPCSRPVAQG